MNKLVMRMLKNMPQFSDQIIHGQSYLQRDMTDFVDKILSGMTRGMNAPFKYIGIKEMSPKDEVRSNILKTDGSEQIRIGIRRDITTSDVRKYLLTFEYDGVPIYTQLYLPVIRDGGIITISGTRFYIAPVLTDPIVSVMNSHIFVRFMNDKLRIKDRAYRLIVDNSSVFAGVIYVERIFKKAKISAGGFGDVETPFALHLLARMPLSEVLHVYGNMDNTDFLITDDKERIKKLSEEYHVYSPTGMQLPGMKKIVAEKSPYSILIRKEKQNEFAKQLAVSILYTFDAIPHRAKETVEAIGTKHEVRVWELILGTMIFKDNYSFDRIMSAVKDHLNTLDNYVYSIVQEMFQDMGINVNNFQDFIAYIMYEYNNLRARVNSADNNSIANKSLDVVYYILYGMIEATSKSVSEIERLHEKNKLTMKGVDNILKRNILTGLIFNIAKHKKPSLAVSLASSTSDNWAVKIHPVMELQERGDGVHRPSQSNAYKKFPSTVQKLDPLDLVVGNILYLPKQSPTPRVRLNPMCQWDENFKPIIPEEFKAELQQLKGLLSSEPLTDTVVEFLENNQVDDEIKDI